MLTSTQQLIQNDLILTLNRLAPKKPHNLMLDSNFASNFVEETEKEGEEEIDIPKQKNKITIQSVKIVSSRRAKVT